MISRNFWWFVAAGSCVVSAALIFAGRSQLQEWLGEPLLYRGTILLGWALLACTAGALTQAFTPPGPEPADTPRPQEGI